jgi:hypothetical protein
MAVDRHKAHQRNTRLIPLAFEVFSGQGKERRVMRTMSARRANQVYDRLIEEGNQAEIWLGSLLVRDR